MMGTTEEIHLTGYALSLTATQKPYNLEDPKEIFGLSVENFAYVMLIVGGAAPVIFIVIVCISMKCVSWRRHKRHRSDNGMSPFQRSYPQQTDIHQHKQQPTRSPGGYHGAMTNGYVNNGFKQSSQDVSIAQAESYGVHSYGEPAYGEGYRLSTNNPNVYFGTLNPPKAKERRDLNQVNYSPTGVSVLNVSPSHPVPSPSAQLLRHSSINSEERSALAAFDSIYEGMDVSGNGYDMVYSNGGIHPMPGVVQKSISTSALNSANETRKQKKITMTNLKDASLQTSSVESLVTGTVYSTTIHPSDLLPAKPSTVTQSTQTSSGDYELRVGTRTENIYNEREVAEKTKTTSFTHNSNHKQVESGELYNQIHLSSIELSSAHQQWNVDRSDSSSIQGSNEHASGQYFSTQAASILSQHNSNNTSPVRHKSTSSITSSINTNRPRSYISTEESASTIASTTESESDYGMTSYDLLNRSGTSKFVASTHQLSSDELQIHQTSFHNVQDSVVLRKTRENISNSSSQNIKQTISVTKQTMGTTVHEEEDEFNITGIRPPSPFSHDNAAYVPDQ